MRGTKPEVETAEDVLEIESICNQELLQHIEDLTTSIENMKMYRKDTADNRIFTKKTDELYQMKIEAQKRGLHINRHYGYIDPVRESILEQR